VAVAEHEERTKALAAAKRRGVKLGGYRANTGLTAKARKAGHAANARVAADRAQAIYRFDGPFPN
jgi:hypothetical protein